MKIEKFMQKRKEECCINFNLRQVFILTNKSKK